VDPESLPELAHVISLDAPSVELDDILFCGSRSVTDALVHPELRLHAGRVPRE
jgi:hypothetical protein